MATPDDRRDPRRDWSEAEWERHVHDLDLRATRVGELLETIGDTPDAAEQLARELGHAIPPGWMSPDDDDNEDDADAAPQDGSLEPADLASRSEAYAASLALAVRLVRLGQRSLRTLDHPSVPHEEWAECSTLAVRASRDLAREAGLGDQGDVRTGRIVLTRLALNAARLLPAALDRLIEAGGLDRRTGRRLQRQVESLLSGIERHMLDLRRSGGR